MSVVDTIFRIGHWNQEIADRWHLDRTEHLRGIADSRADKTEKTKPQIAHIARREAHYQLQRYTKYRNFRQPAGICSLCGTETTLARVKCWVCNGLACQECHVAEHVLCNYCKEYCHTRPDHTRDYENLHYLPPGRLAPHAQSSACESYQMEKNSCQAVASILRLPLCCWPARSATGGCASGAAVIKASAIASLAQPCRTRQRAILAWPSGCPPRAFLGTRSLV